MLWRAAAQQHISTAAPLGRQTEAYAVRFDIAQCQLGPCGALHMACGDAEDNTEGEQWGWEVQGSGVGAGRGWAAGAQKGRRHLVANIARCSSVMLTRCME